MSLHILQSPMLLNLLTLMVLNCLSRNLTYRRRKCWILMLSLSLKWNWLPSVDAAPLLKRSQEINSTVPPAKRISAKYVNQCHIIKIWLACSISTQKGNSSADFVRTYWLSHLQLKELPSNMSAQRLIAFHSARNIAAKTKHVSILALAIRTREHAKRHAFTQNALKRTLTSRLGLIGIQLASSAWNLWTLPMHL